MVGQNLFLQPVASRAIAVAHPVRPSDTRSCPHLQTLVSTTICRREPASHSASPITAAG